MTLNEARDRVAAAWPGVSVHVCASCRRSVFGEIGQPQTENKVTEFSVWIDHPSGEGLRNASHLEKLVLAAEERGAAFRRELEAGLGTDEPADVTVEVEP